MISPLTPRERLAQRILEMERRLTEREEVITLLVDDATIMRDALTRIGVVQGQAGLLARTALRACAHTRGRDGGLTTLARVEPSSGFMEYQGFVPKAVEVHDPTVVERRGKDWPPVPE